MKTYENVIKAATNPITVAHLTGRGTNQPSKFATFLSEHLVKDRMIVWYRKGDGQKYGWKNDQSLRADASHYGFKSIEIK